MVASSIQNLPAFVDSGQHSIVTAPADTGPSPRMRNLTLRGSGSTSFLPAPLVALSCNGLRTLIIVARSSIGILSLCSETHKVATHVAALANSLATDMKPAHESRRTGRFRSDRNVCGGSRRTQYGAFRLRR